MMAMMGDEASDAARVSFNAGQAAESAASDNVAGERRKSGSAIKQMEQVGVAYSETAEKEKNKEIGAKPASGSCCVVM